MSASLELKNVQKKFGGVVATNDLSLSVPKNSLTAIIGPNGAGKTTLFNIITGHLKPDSGSISLDGESIVGLSRMALVKKGIGRSFQIASLFPTFRVLDTVVSSMSAGEDRLRNPFARGRSADLVRSADEIVEIVGLGDRRSSLSSQLSHGDQKLLDIAIAMALKPRILLLDEPMAGMGREERRLMTECMQRLHKQFGLTLIFIEHDMDVVFSVAETVGVLQQGRIIAHGEPAYVRNHPDVIKAYLGSEAA